MCSDNKLHKLQSTGDEQDLSEYFKAKKAFGNTCQMRKQDSMRTS